MSDTKAIVGEFWRRMNANDWAFAAELFAPDCCVDWPQSSERIRGAANFAALNAAYPAKASWRFEVKYLIVEGEMAVSETAITDGDAQATAISIFTVNAGMISHIREYWPDPYEAPGWRAQWVEKL